LNVSLSFYVYIYNWRVFFDVLSGGFELFMIIDGQFSDIFDLADLFFFVFKINQDLKILGFFIKLYPRVLGLVAIPDSRVIFIILIIIINLG